MFFDTGDSLESSDNKPYTDGVRFDHHRRRNYPMTLIAALICQDCVLVGSDSKVEDELGTYKQPKLYKLLDSNFVFGGSGDGRIIADIGTWLISHKTFNNLDTNTQDKQTIRGMWIEKLSRQLASLNGANIARIQLSKVQPGLDQSSVTGELLVAGFLREAPLLLTINRHGVPSYDTGHWFTASGSECQRFVGAIQTLMPNGFQKTPLKEAVEVFAKALDASIKNSGKADFPVQMWVAKPKSVEQIVGLEDPDKPTLDRLSGFLAKNK